MWIHAAVNIVVSCVIVCLAACGSPGYTRETSYIHITDLSGELIWVNVTSVSGGRVSGEREELPSGSYYVVFGPKESLAIRTRLSELFAEPAKDWAAYQAAEEKIGIEFAAAELVARGLCKGSVVLRRKGLHHFDKSMDTAIAVRCIEGSE